MKDPVLNSMGEESNIQVLEHRIDTLERELKQERAVIKTLLEKQEKVDRKISTAETIGRLVIYMLLGASAFLTQMQSLLKWIRGQ